MGGEYGVDTEVEEASQEQSSVAILQSRSQNPVSNHEV